MERRGRPFRTEAPPARAHAQLAAAAFYEREKQRLSTYNVPQFIRCYREGLDWLHLPRGLLGAMQSTVEAAGSRLDILDDRPAPARHEFAFRATLDDTQRRGVEALLRHKLGVLVAPPGDGKP